MLTVSSLIFSIYTIDLRNGEIFKHQSIFITKKLNTSHHLVAYHWLPGSKKLVNLDVTRKELDDSEKKAARTYSQFERLEQEISCSRSGNFRQ
jgi:hypothetical protein